MSVSRRGFLSGVAALSAICAAPAVATAVSGNAALLGSLPKHYWPVVVSPRGPFENTRNIKFSYPLHRELMAKHGVSDRGVTEYMEIELRKIGYHVVREIEPVDFDTYRIFELYTAKVV